MILTSLRVKNFRQYKGVHEIQFADASKKSTTIAMGAMGAGKTNLFLALNWCLYGLGMEDKGVVVSKGLPTEIRDEGGFVEVHFRHEGFKYQARREIIVRGDIEIPGDLQLQELGADGRARQVQNPTQKLNTILPVDARRYFFFDGERIREMSEPGHEEQVREAIRSVLKLKVLERAADHLSAVEAEFAKTVQRTASASKDLQRLIEEAETLKARIHDLRERTLTKDEERAAAQRQLDELTSRLRSLDEVKAVLVEERENSQALKNAQIRYRELVDGVAELVARSGPAIASAKTHLAAGVLNEKRKRGEIPSNIRETLIDDLVRERVCICERPLDAESTEALLRRKQSAVPNVVEDAILSASGHIATLEGVGQDIPERLTRVLRQIAEARDEMEERHRRNDELREKLQGDYSDDIAALERSRRGAETRVRDLTYELARLDSNIEFAEKEQADLTAQRELIEVESEAVRRDLRRYELARAATDAAEELLKNFSQSMRQQIREETESIFKQMIWKEEHFERVEIHPDYRLDVIDRYGASALPEVSEGERQLLSLAFILAMAKVSGEEATLVIDTPFARISKEPLHNVAKVLPKLVGQLVLFVTDKELDDEASKLIEPHVGRAYELHFDDETGTTSIVGA